MPKRVCSYPGCKMSCDRSEKYCDDHKKEGSSRDYNRDKLYPCRSYKYLYNSVRWRKKREAQLMKEPLCVDCLAQGRQELATIADHVVDHKGDLNLFWYGKLQSLCAGHHSKKTRRENQKK